MIRTSRRRSREMPKRDDKREDKREDKQDFKLEKQTAKRSSKVDLTLAKAQKSLATGYKRKWLVFLIAILLGGYMILKGGLGGGFIEGIKSKLGM